MDILIQRYGRQAAAPLLCLFGSGIIHQNLAHIACRRGKKEAMPGTAPLPGRVQTQIGLIDQRRGREGVVVPLIPHKHRSDTLQLAVGCMVDLEIHSRERIEVIFSKVHVYIG